LDFLIRIKYRRLTNQNLINIQNVDEPILEFITSRKAFITRKYFTSDVEFHVVGDIIFPKEIVKNQERQADYLYQNFIQNTLFHLKGFHYIIILDYKENRIEVHSCFLNILPVYFYNLDDYCFVSSSLMVLCKYIEPIPEPNESYIIEKILFNYSFRNNTPFQNVFLMPSCSFISIEKNGLKTKNEYSLENYFIDTPFPWQNNLDKLSDIYFTELLSYIPEKPYALTLTGGFDSRTILSAALKKNVAFQTFSYGSQNDPDIIIPELIGKSMGFPYTPFLLNDEFAENDFWNDGITFLLKSEGAGNLSRGHYVYTAKKLAESSDYILTGNFGSELIRSMKESGVMASEPLFALFEFDDKDKFVNYVCNIQQLNFINTQIKDRNLNVLLDEAWAYKLSLPKSFTTNQKFYMYLFGEVFRKYFGPEIIIQSEFLLNRSPFIDYNIFKSTLECSIAGVYQNFKERSPIKRFHGQILYAHIIKKLHFPLLNIKLDRTYKPKDFLTLLGRIFIIIGHIKRIILNNGKNKLSPSYSKSFYEKNHEEIKTALANSKYLNKDIVMDVFLSGKWKTHHNEFVNALSLELFFQKTKIKK
jgi:asparagine synthase (glutamine-hydrolysing)